jgi:8-oxo-dGTP pyrophosphatase MutT (NUDIX family)
MSWPSAQAIREALLRHPATDVPAPPGRTSHKPAGVLVPLCWEPGPVVLLTLRSSALSRHAGEISFPGGRPEPGDRDIEATALREAREELGIEQAEVLGRLSTMPLYTSDYRLVPFVAAVKSAGLRPDPGEVAALLRAPVAELLERPGIEAIPYMVDGEERLSPVFYFEGHALYGGTAHSLLELLEVLAPLHGKPVPPLIPSGLQWQDVMVY